MEKFLIFNFFILFSTLLVLMITFSMIFATPLTQASTSTSARKDFNFNQNWPETKNEHKKFKNFIPKPRVKRQYGGNMGPMMGMGGFGGGNSMANAIASSNSGGFGGNSNAMAMAASSNYGGFGNPGSSSTAFASANSGGGFGGGSSATAFTNANSFKK